MARRGYRNREFYYYQPTKAREVEGGLKARSKRGSFAASWWASRWIEALERLVDRARLQRGRAYARKGQVVSIEEKQGRIQARVQGSRKAAYRVTIEVEPLGEAEWGRVLDRLADQALFSAQLLAGEMPQEIEAVFAAAGVSLFPDRAGGLVTDCSCPDWANPCKHVAAVHYILGERFDEDPFLLFRLRGRSHEQVLAALRERRSGQLDLGEELEEGDEAEAVAALEDTLDRFWELGESMEPFPLSIQASSVPMPVLKRLGDPAFVTGRSLEAALGPALAAISAAATAAAYGDDAIDI